MFAELNTNQEEAIYIKHIVARLKEVNPDMDKNLRVRNFLKLCVYMSWQFFSSIYVQEQVGVIHQISARAVKVITIFFHKGEVGSPILNT